MSVMWNHGTQQGTPHILCWFAAVSCKPRPLQSPALSSARSPCCGSCPCLGEGHGLVLAPWQAAGQGQLSGAAAEPSTGGQQFFRFIKALQIGTDLASSALDTNSRSWALCGCMTWGTAPGFQQCCSFGFHLLSTHCGFFTWLGRSA